MRAEVVASRAVVAILLGPAPSVREGRSWGCAELVSRRLPPPVTAAGTAVHAYASPDGFALSTEPALRCLLGKG